MRFQFRAIDSICDVEPAVVEPWNCSAVRLTESDSSVARQKASFCLPFGAPAFGASSSPSGVMPESVKKRHSVDGRAVNRVEESPVESSAALPNFEVSTGPGWFQRLKCRIEYVKKFTEKARRWSSIPTIVAGVVKGAAPPPGGGAPGVPLSA